MQDVRVAGDEVVDLEGVFRRDAPRMWRALLAYTADPDVASDALAEAFAQALVRGAELRSPAAWTWKAAFQIASGELKRRRTPPPTAPEPVQLSESVRDLVVALRRLSPKQRAAVVLHDYADRPTAEVAATLDVSVATVRVHLSQGRRRLRKLLEDYR
jgi:RNA polymerase sigma-70 factor (ECF subfamily)